MSNFDCVPYALGVVDGAVAQQPDGPTLPNISDDHVDFGKSANSHALATLEEAIVRVTALRDRLWVAAIDRWEPRRHPATALPPMPIYGRSKSRSPCDR